METRENIKAFSESVSTTASNWEKELGISDFKLGRGLGAGKFGQVFIAQYFLKKFIGILKADLFVLSKKYGKMV